MLEFEEKTQDQFTQLTKIERNGDNLLVKFRSGEMKFKPQFNFDQGREPLVIENVKWPVVPKGHTEF